MASQVCMNVSCGGAASERKKGWELRSGGFAILCDKCGAAFEQLVFCDTFHLNESGWRECSTCGKRLHCGCIASKDSFELLDNGGVECINCVKLSDISSIPSEAPQSVEPQSLHKLLPLPLQGEKRFPQTSVSDTDNDVIDNDPTDQGRLVQSRNDIDSDEQDDKRELKVLSSTEDRPCFSNINQSFGAYASVPKEEDHKETKTNKDMQKSMTCVNTVDTFSRSGSINEKIQNFPLLQQRQKSRHLLPKPPKVITSVVSENSKDTLAQMRVARPPVEGRGRNQLLPRYWPRITDQELQQISGDSNSTIVPLFEKVLSASDAGRIGRLVLPKACAETYFPPIYQPEGLPLKIQDAKGKEWIFQFRFWPNNNSRMYVLEGVTPCIQSMQLQAGDTVTFSRMDPEGKLVMGFRKATNSIPIQDNQISAFAVDLLPSESFFSGSLENLPLLSGYSGFLQSLKGNANLHFNELPKHINNYDVSIGWNKTEKHGRSFDGSPLPSVLTPEKRTRNIGSKSKRLHIDDQDALELKLTWEEAQDLLRPPPRAKPSIVVIEDHEFEEYEEPPVFGKRTLFTVGSTGGEDQWAQCDVCCKWRRIPVDALLPPKWTCADNVWHPSRCSCSSPEDVSATYLENLIRISNGHKSSLERDVPGLDVLATATTLGHETNPSIPSIATTTRHPRHRPGCTCIVCIQPPSGKGPKHKPTCTCNVCSTVKRRFKTLMMRKKKRQSEREAEVGSKRASWARKDKETEKQSLESEAKQDDPSNALNEMVKGKIDLNCDPEREEEPIHDGTSQRVSMMSLLQAASLPLVTYLRQNGLTSLGGDQELPPPPPSSFAAVPPVTSEDDEQNESISPYRGELEKNTTEPLG